MATSVLTVAEVKDGNLRNVSLEVLAAAQRIADGGPIASVLFGGEADGFASLLGEYGATQVYVVRNQEAGAKHPEACFQALHQLAGEVQPQAILIPHTGMGKDLAPRLAARLQLGLVSDVIDVQLTDGEVVFTRPIYAGKAFEKRKMGEGIPFATIRPNNLAPVRNGDSAVEVVDYTAEIKDLRTVVKEVVCKTAGRVDLTEAKIVISGGRGVKSAEGFQLLQELADLLGGAVGASRGACDAGYCDYALQVGQTGKVVTPDLYIAAGISGAIQHVAGMSNSRVIVAINKDAEAPIFQVADYGIAGDLFEVIPLLIQEFKNILKS